MLIQILPYIVFANKEIENFVDENTNFLEEIQDNNEVIQENIVNNETNENQTNEIIKEEVIKQESNIEKKEIISKSNNINVIKDTLKTHFIDTEYSFYPKFTSNTKVETKGMTNYEEDFKKYTNNEKGSISKDDWCLARITNNNQKGNIWIRYNNVGMFEGETVDMKITLKSWNYLQPANKSASSLIGGKNYPCIGFCLNGFDITCTSYPAIDTPIYVIEFFHHNTNNIINISGHFTFRDIDNGETIDNLTNSYKIYISKNSVIKNNNTKLYCDVGTSSSNSDIKNWATVLYKKTSSIKYVYTRIQDIKGNSIRDITKKASATVRNFYSTSLTGKSIIPFDTPNIRKSFVDKDNICNTTIKSWKSENIKSNDIFYETIEIQVPEEEKEYYYNSLDIIDYLHDVYDFLGIYKIIGINNKKDCSSFFTVKTKNIENEYTNGEKYKETKLTISADKTALLNSNFYNNNYYITLKLRKKDNYNMKYYNYNSKNYIGNRAFIHIKRSNIPRPSLITLPKNEVTNLKNIDYIPKNEEESLKNNSKIDSTLKSRASTTYAITSHYADLETEAINGAIDTLHTDEYLWFGNSKTINYKPNPGYKLKSVIVNDKEVDITKFKTSYTIDNVLLNKYKIKVVFEKIIKDLGKITLTKLGEKNIRLSGVEFKLYDNNMNLIYTKSTDENGQIIFDKLAYGKYTLIETKTLPGYEIKKDKIELQVSTNNPNVEIIVKNNYRLKLPISGGYGSIIFIIAGLILMIFAVIISKKIRKNKRKKK